MQGFVLWQRTTQTIPLLMCHTPHTACHDKLILGVCFVETGRHRREYSSLGNLDLLQRYVDSQSGLEEAWSSCCSFHATKHALLIRQTTMSSTFDIHVPSRQTHIKKVVEDRWPEYLDIFEEEVGICWYNCSDLPTHRAVNPLKPCCPLTCHTANIVPSCTLCTAKSPLLTGDPGVLVEALLLVCCCNICII